MFRGIFEAIVAYAEINKFEHSLQQKTHHRAISSM